VARKPIDRNRDRRIERRYAKMRKEREIEMLMSVLSHEAGYGVNLLGVMDMHTTEHQTIEITYQRSNARTLAEGMFLHKSFALKDMKKACLFFMKARHALQLGVDYETTTGTNVPPSGGRRIK
jgi:hypothetical protein